MVQLTAAIYVPLESGGNIPNGCIGVTSLISWLSSVEVAERKAWWPLFAHAPPPPPPKKKLWGGGGGGVVNSLVSL